MSVCCENDGLLGWEGGPFKVELLGWDDFKVTVLHGNLDYGIEKGVLRLQHVYLWVTSVNKGSFNL